MQIKPIFAWYDFWIGVFWDSKKRVLYIFPIPMFGLRVSLDSAGGDAQENDDYSLYSSG